MEALVVEVLVVEVLVVEVLVVESAVAGSVTCAASAGAVVLTVGREAWLEDVVVCGASFG